MKILLADDHILVRDTIRAYIERAQPGIEVMAASTLDEALEHLRRPGAETTDIVILDLKMPGMDGVASLNRVKALQPEVPVAIMSGLATRDVIREAMVQGAAGFLPKTLAAKALVSAIQLMIAGERFVPQGSADDVDDATGSGDSLAFTKRELDVLGYLYKGLSNKEIARELDLREVTVKLHVRGLCRKLDAQNRTQAVIRAMELGIQV